MSSCNRSKKKKYEGSNDESISSSTFESALQPKRDREDWMSMTGMIKTYTKDDIKPKVDPKDKRHINSYNPSTSARELNPYWKNGGEGLPQTSTDIIKSRPFLKPKHEDDYYSTSKKKHNEEGHRSSNTYRSENNDSHRKRDSYKSHSRSSNWKKESKSDRYEKRIKDFSPERSNKDTNKNVSQYDQSDRYEKTIKDFSPERSNKDTNKNESQYDRPTTTHHETSAKKVIKPKQSQSKDHKYLSDEKLNKLAAKIVKAEIMGDKKLVDELKAKLDQARSFRQENPDAGQSVQGDGVMLTTMDKMGNARPLSKPSVSGDPRSKGGKHKAETHSSGERLKYFSNDDQYNLSQMFEQEKYGNNYNDEAEFAKIASKHKNPNDDLADIFTEEITKNRNDAKDSSRDKQKAIRQHVQMEKTLDGCGFCIDSKNMLKHLIVGFGSKTYVALPSKVSLVPGHCYISSLHHAPCATAVDEDVWEEIMDYRKALTKYFNSKDHDVVFYETAVKLQKHPHMVIHCVPLPRDVGDMASIYFKKALLECETEWAVNKKVIELKGRNVRKGVPKGLPYFWVDFAIDPGFAHVIEDQNVFPKTFAEEIIGGMLDLEHSLWKNPLREQGDQQRKKVLEFVQTWKHFDTVSKK